MLLPNLPHIVDSMTKSRHLRQQSTAFACVFLCDVAFGLRGSYKATRSRGPGQSSNTEPYRSRIFEKGEHAEEILKNTAMTTKVDNYRARKIV